MYSLVPNQATTGSVNAGAVIKITTQFDAPDSQAVIDFRVGSTHVNYCPDRYNLVGDLKSC